MSSATAASAPIRSEARAQAGLGARLLVFVLFFGSGMAGLIYEVVWSRHLTYRFGATLDAVTAILVAFMGGLALGAWLLGRRADRSRHPLALYGKLEILIGLSALALPLLLEVVTPVYQALVNSGFVDGFLARRLLRFAFTILLLLIPTTAMGATLPALSRFLARSSERLGLNIGGLYTLNTAGAVAGAFLSGFFLIPNLGVTNTLWLAVGLNVGAGAIALGLSRALGEADDFQAMEALSKTQKKKKKKAKREAKKRLEAELGAPTAATHPRLAASVYAVSGFVALAFQVVWFRALIINFQILKSTTYTFSSMLTVFLIGLAAGSLVMTPLADKVKRPYMMFGLLEALIGLCGLFSFACVAHGWPGSLTVQDMVFTKPESSQWFWAIGYLFARTGVAILPATFAMGLLFPIAARCYVGSAKEVGGDVGRLYAANTVGAIFGAFLATFVIVPAMGMGWAILGLSATSLLLGMVVTLLAGEAPPPVRFALGLGPAAAGLLAIAFKVGPLPYPIEFHWLHPVDNMVYYADGPLGTVSVVQNHAGERRIYVDKVGVAGTDPVMLTDQKSLAHVPMLFIPEPKKVLTVGFGSGGASYSFSTYPQLEEIHCVEIDPTVPRAAITLTRSNWGFVAPKYRVNGEEKFFLPEHAKRRLAQDGKTHTNPLPQIWDWLPSERDHRPTPKQLEAMAARGEENVYEEIRAPADAELIGYYAADPRYRLVLDDAREWLQSTDTVYDVIATDCTDLRYKTNANLYDLQYFKACRDRVSDQGLVVVWMPMGGLTEKMYKVALKTFAEAFPTWGVWFMSNEPTHYCLLLGWKGDFKIDLPTLKERLQIPAVKRDLAELFLDSPEKILSCYVADNNTLDEWLGDVPLNTEDRPVLEFEAPKALRNDLEGQLAANLQGMVDRRNDVMAYVTGPEDEVAAMRESLKPWEEAEPILIEGQRHYRDGVTFEELLPALRAYEKALAICPQDASIRNQLDFHEIRKSAEKGQQGHDQLMLGRLYKAQGRLGEALTWFKMLTDREPPSRERSPENFRLFVGWQRLAQEEVASIYEAEGRPERAAKARARAKELQPLEAGEDGS